MTVAEMHLNPKKRGGCAAVVLCSSPEDRGAVSAALLDWDVDFRERARDVIAALKATGAPLFVTRHADADDAMHTALLRDIREEAPAFDIVALTRSGDRDDEALVALTQFGVADVLRLDDPEFPERFIGLVRRTRLTMRAADCARELSAGMPVRDARLIQWAFQRGLRCGSVSEFAAAKGVSNQTLRWRLSHYNLTPESLLRWRKVIAAFVLFEHTLLTVDRVARRVGFPSGPALHNAISRTAGISRRRVLQAGGTSYLIAQLRSKMGL